MSERMDTETWANCYEGGWNGLIVPEAYSHPAKMSRALVKRIFDELALPRGSLVVDPFGGIGSTGIEASSRGIRSVLVELEPVFVSLAEQTFAMHRAAWEHMGFPLPIIIQGDSRELRRHVAGVDAVISSPPYAELGVKIKGHGIKGAGVSHDKNYGEAEYGDTPGQLGAMPAGSVDAVISSPPFGQAQSGGGISKAMRGEGSYGVTTAMPGSVYGAAEREPGNLEALPLGDVDAIVSSPPYETEALGHSREKKGNEGHPATEYGKTAGQLSELSTGTFWESAAIIVAECHAVLKPNGIAVWVTKDFIRAKKRVPFTDDWIRLCEAAGFVLERRVRASLVKEQRGGHMFEGEYRKVTKRVSFFRRLYEKKYPENAIDEEDVTFFRRVTA